MKHKLKRGKTQPVYKCCREIRIQMPGVKGKIYYATNFGVTEEEAWLCIKVTKDYNYNIMQRVYPKEDTQ